jgi:hypothetical protein
MSSGEYDAFMEVLDELEHPTQNDDLELPPHRWSFICESKEDRPPADPEMVEALRMPSGNIVRNLNIQISNREARKMGVDTDILVQNNFLAVHPFYKDEFDENKKQEFWLAKIDAIDQEHKMVDVHYYNAPTKNNASYEKGMVVYRVYQGPQATEDRIPLSRIIVQIKKPTKCKAVPVKYRRRVMDALAAAAAAAARAAKAAAEAE